MTSSPSSRLVMFPMVPYEAPVDLDRSAVIIIDMQVDFLKVSKAYHFVVLVVNIMFDC
jgi:hypothetical protein